MYYIKNQLTGEIYFSQFEIEELFQDWIKEDKFYIKFQMLLANELHDLKIVEF